MVKILAIDDNSFNLVSLKAVLNDSFPDTKVITASSGREGIALADIEDPDVILLDILMPVMDGYSVCRQLKMDKRMQSIPVVFLTAMKENKESRIQAIRAGAEAFLFKPIDETELITQINAMVKIKAANRTAELEKQRLNTLVDQRTRELQENEAAMLNLLEDLRKENLARANSEAALTNLSARNQAILDSVPDIIMEVNNDKVYTWANTAGKNFFGEQVVGKEAGYYFEGQQNTYNYVSPVFIGSAVDVVYLESWQKRQDGQKRLLAWWCKTLRDESGKITGALSAAQDITDNKLNQEKIFRNSQEQALLAEISKNLAGITDLNEAYQYIGNEIYKLIGDGYVFISTFDTENDVIRLKITVGLDHFLKKIKKIIEIDPYEINAKLTEFKPEDLALYKGNKLINLPKNGLYSLGVRKISKVAGRSLELVLGIKNTYAMGFSLQERVYGGVGILLKYSNELEHHTLIETIINNASVAIQRLFAQQELDRNNRLLNDMMDNSPSLIYMFDTRNRLISINRKFEELLSRRREEIIGFTREMLLDRKITKQHIENDKEVIKRGAAISFDEENLEGDGMHYYFTTKFPLFDNKGTIYGIGGISHDITERKRADEKLKNYNEQLRNYAAHNDSVREQERINLARDMHDIFGSSLAGLKMELTLLRNEIINNYKTISPEIESLLKDMTDQVDESVTLMRKIVRELRPGLLEELGIEEAIRWYLAEAEKRSGILFKVTSSLKSNPLNKGEQSSIVFKIFQEIISNIIRHSGALNATITIQVKRNVFILDVFDDGKGISEDELKRMDSFGIMGMKERALLVDGDLQICGSVNQGTKVHFEMPIRK
jgi:PAS domain S-box-containing protein